MTISLSSKGQLVLPSEIREKHQLTAHSKLEVLDFGKEIVLIPLPKDPFNEARGILKGVSTQDLVQSRRKERACEHAK